MLRLIMWCFWVRLNSTTAKNVGCRWPLVQYHSQSLNCFTIQCSQWSPWLSAQSHVITVMYTQHVPSLLACAGSTINGSIYGPFALARLRLSLSVTLLLHFIKWSPINICFPQSNNPYWLSLLSLVSVIQHYLKK